MLISGKIIAESVETMVVLSASMGYAMNLPKYCAFLLISFFFFFFYAYSIAWWICWCLCPCFRWTSADSASVRRPLTLVSPRFVFFFFPSFIDSFTFTLLNSLIIIISKSNFYGIDINPHLSIKQYRWFHLPTFLISVSIFLLFFFKSDLHVYLSLWHMRLVSVLDVW